MPKRLVLLDSHAILFRAFHAMPDSFTSPDGRPSGAVYGFVNVLLRVLKELEPTWVVACFDSPGPTFREQQYAEYKGTRAETPEGIIVQEPMVKEVLDAMSIPHLALSGFEADDLIATLMKQALDKKEVEEVVVVTGDRDLLQLSQERVLIYLMRQGTKEIELLDLPAVEKLIEVPISQFLEWKALRGDPSDNIKGVAGIGDKTAIDLIKKFGTLEKLYEAAENEDEKITPRVRGLLVAGKESAFQSRELLTVRHDAPVNLDLEKADRIGYRRAEAIKILHGFGIKSAITRLPEEVNSKQASLFGE